MKHIRPLGESYTTLSEGAKKALQRGVLLTDTAGQVSPDETVELFRKRPDHVTRMVISTLDKTIKKKRTLKYMHPEGYLLRGKLANAIWSRLTSKVEVSDELYDSWKAKVHPYLRSSVQSFDNPALDKNYQKIIEVQKRDGIIPDDFRGDRFHDWGNIENDPAAAADQIIKHLFKEEKKLVRREISSAVKTVRKEGRLTRSATAIAESAQDPRKNRKSKPDPERRWDDGDVASRDLSEANDWSIYCGTPDIGDIAAKLFGDAVNKLLAQWRGEKQDSQFLKREHFGQRIYEHFGSLNDTTAGQDELRGRLYLLNLAAKKHYAQISNSNRYRRTWTDADLQRRMITKFENMSDLKNRPDRAAAEAILKRVMPETWADLRNQLLGKERNADTSQLLRLGKMIIHAADMPFDTPVDEADSLFHKRMDFFATSDGQSEIKRAETFNRVWRNAINVSAQTLKNYLSIDPVDADPETDIFQNNTTLAAVIETVRPDHVRRHGSLVFGNDASSTGTSRAALIGADGDDGQLRSNLRLLGQVAAEFRHRAFHFSTMRHVIAKLEKGIASPSVREPAARTFQELLQFDADLRLRAWEDEITALNLRAFLSNTQLTQLAEETSDVNAATEVMVPKFKALMKYVGHIVKADEQPNPALKKLSEHKLDSDSLTIPGNNRTRVGLLRFVYQRGFETWLQEKITDEALLKEIVDRVREKGLRRSAAENKERGLVALIPTSRLERFNLQDSETLAQLFQRLAREATKEERIHRQYRPNKEKQKEISNELEKLRKEVFAYLFVEYLRDKELQWVHTVEELDEDQCADATPNPVLLKMPEDEWCPLFYGWLYLLPAEDVSLLRHQFKKTAALEQLEKAGSRSPSSEESIESKNAATLSKLDQLMGLYCRVQAVGFDGTEHTLNNTLPSKKLGKFFETDEDFAALFDPENGDLDVKRTRRGLRQIERFGHLDDLGPIFRKHSVKSSEVQRASEARKAEGAFEAARQKTREEILDHLEAAREAPL